MIQPILGYLVVLVIVAALLTLASVQQRRRRWERWQAETQNQRFDGRPGEPRRGRRIGLRIVIMLLAVIVLVLLFFVVVALYGLLTHQTIQFP